MTKRFIETYVSKYNPLPENTRSSLKKEMITIQERLSRKDILLNLLNQTEYDLVLVEYAEKIHPTKPISLFNGRFHPSVSEAKLMLSKMKANIEEDLKDIY